MQPPATQPSAAAPGQAYALQPNQSPVVNDLLLQPANSRQLRDCSTLAIRPDALDPTVAFIVQPHKTSGGPRPAHRGPLQWRRILPVRSAGISCISPALPQSRTGSCEPWIRRSSTIAGRISPS